MKKILFLILILFFVQNYSFATKAYNENGKVGLKDGEIIIVKARYQKLIRLGETAWIAQYHNKFGIINDGGECLVKPKYNHVERVFGKFVKLGNEKDFGLYDETGKAVIKPEYTAIEPLFGKMFLTCKNYKYGVVDENGTTLIANDFDEIYMPTPKIMRLKYEGEWYQIEELKPDEINLPEGVKKVTINNKELKVTTLLVNTGVISGYSVVTATDYFLKLFSSISPAYEETIDELMFSKGAETVTIFMKLGWIPRFPFTYAKKYYNNVVTPNNGPLAEVKNDLINQIK